MATEDEKKEVYLEADKELPGQHYVALSFLSPNKVLENKDIYFFSEFIKDYELQYKVKATESFIMKKVADVQASLSKIQDAFEVAKSGKTNIEVTDLSGVAEILAETRKTLTGATVSDLEAHVKAEMSDYRVSKIKDDYETFMYKNKKKMEDDFFASNSFRTTIQGLKVRGVYDTYNEALNRAKTLQKLDPSFNVYVGQVGFWLPWDPEPHAVADQEYADEQLNTLMKKYRENEATRDELYAAEKVSRMGNAKVKGAPAKSTAQIGGAGPSTEDVPKSMFETEDLGIARRRERIEKKVDEVVEVAKNVVTHA
jgi:hypothetical protein